MNMTEKISIIVPIYGVEKYIDHCIESLCNQTYTNLEILLVDDGSKDKSGLICDEWTKKDRRIKVLHIQNGGQSHARNAGLDVASGDYIGFVDGDDAACPNMYETLLKLSKKYNADIAECNFVGRKSKEPDEMEEGMLLSMNGRDAIRRQLDKRIISRYPSTSLWSKLFKAEVIRDMRLPSGKIHEEYGFLCQAFLRCGRYVYLNERLYERTLRDDSTTAAAFSERAFDKLDVFRMRNRFLMECGEQELYRLSREQEFELMLHYYGESAGAGLIKYVQMLEQELKSNRKEIICSDLSVKRKLQFALIMVSPWIYKQLRQKNK